MKSVCAMLRFDCQGAIGRLELVWSWALVPYEVRRETLRA